MTDEAVDLRAHLQGISIRLGHQLHAPGGRSATGTHHLCAELWALREVGWRGAAATLLHDARGQLPLLPSGVVAMARAHLFGDARASFAKAVAAERPALHWRGTER